MLSLMAICTLLIQLVGLIPAVVLFVAGFVVIALYSSMLTRLDPSGAVSELTALRMLRGGIRHRYTANFDLPGV
jgi:hypothetical protein